MSKTEDDLEKRKSLRLYAAFGAAVIISFFPHMLAAMMSLILFTGVMISAYVLKSEAKEGSLLENHMIFIIRTMWIGGFVALIGVIIGSVYLLENHDNSFLNKCAEQLLDNIGNIPNMGAAASDLIKPCIDSYWIANKKTVIISGAISVLPALLYFLVRYTRGLSRALDGYRVANPKGWL